VAAHQRGMLQYLLSFVTEIQVESTSSRYNPKLDVVFSAGRYRLDTVDATYSYEDKYASYGTALYEIRDHLKNMRSVLVLGLGLGSIPFMLQKKYQFTGAIDCVEIDEAVIALAKKYYPKEGTWEKLHIIHRDAGDFIPYNTNRYDLVAVDLFIGKDIPEQFHSTTFLQALKNAVAPGGIILFSRLSSNTRKEKRLNMALPEIFTGAKEIDTNGNLILCWQAPVS